MNIKKVEKSIKKITQLLENIKEENTVNSIERDLLLSYIRDLYEKVLNNEDLAPKASRRYIEEKEELTSYTAPVQKKEAPAPPPVVEIADVVKQEIKEIIQVAQPVVTPPQEEAPVSYQTQTSTIKAEVQTKTEAPQVSQEFLDLFASESINELSDKLSRSPITNLTRSMGINERIFTENELFGGDSSLFNTTMESLDKLTSLEQARDYLVTHVAKDQNWTSEGKIKKAANFIKLISRRY